MRRRAVCAACRQADQPRAAARGWGAERHGTAWLPNTNHLLAPIFSHSLCSHWQARSHWDAAAGTRAAPPHEAPAKTLNQSPPAAAGDCIPPHIDHLDFVRLFVTLSLQSEQSILFSGRIIAQEAGVFIAKWQIPLPTGGVSVREPTC